MVWLKEKCNAAVSFFILFFFSVFPGGLSSFFFFFLLLSSSSFFLSLFPFHFISSLLGSKPCWWVFLQEDETHIVTNGGALPVVEIELKLAVSRAKLELSQESLVVHQGEAVEDIKFLLLNERKKTLQNLQGGKLIKKERGPLWPQSSNL